ncbi:hypothetical protein ACFQ4K_09495 [Tistrella bauzanensis]
MLAARVFIVLAAPVFIALAARVFIALAAPGLTRAATAATLPNVARARGGAFRAPRLGSRSSYRRRSLRMKTYLIVMAPVLLGILLLGLSMGAVDWVSALIVAVIMTLLFVFTMWYRPRG